MAKITQRYDTFEEAMNSLPKRLQKNPYRAIHRYFESLFVNAGKKVFMFAAPQILSPFAPRIKQKGDEKRISINILITANPGGGKTAMMKKIRDITPGNGSNAQLIQHQTDKGLQDLVKASPGGIELLVNDMKTIMGDADLLKTYETVIADGFISRSTNDQDMSNDGVRAAMVAGCVPSDINKQISGGMLQRLVPIYLKYSDDEQKEVMEHIAKGVGKDSPNGVDVDSISKFYDIVYHAIKGFWPDVPKITGYSYNQHQRDVIMNKTSEAISELKHLTDDMNMFRQLWDGYRFSALHCLLNINNRQLKKHGDTADIVIDDRDVQIGASLMQAELGELNGMMNMFGGIKEDMATINQYEQSAYGVDHL